MKKIFFKICGPCLGFFLLLFFSLLVAGAPRQAIKSPKKAPTTSSKNFKEKSLSELKVLIEKYTRNKGVRMNFKKRTYIKLLKKYRNSQGTIFLSRGKGLLKVEDRLMTQILFDGSQLWYITRPRKGAPQVLLLDAQFRRTKNKSLLSSVFNYENFSKNFLLVATRPKGRTQIWDFRPREKNSDMDSFSLKTEKQRLLKIFLKWKSTENEEEYTFSDIRFHQNLSARLFKPPRSTF